MSEQEHLSWRRRPSRGGSGESGKRAGPQGKLCVWRGRGHQCAQRRASGHHSTGSGEAASPFQRADIREQTQTGGLGKSRV